MLVQRQVDSSDFGSEALELQQWSLEYHRFSLALRYASGRPLVVWFSLHFIVAFIEEERSRFSEAATLSRVALYRLSSCAYQLTCPVVAQRGAGCTSTSSLALVSERYLV